MCYNSSLVQKWIFKHRMQIASIQTSPNSMTHCLAATLLNELRYHRESARSAHTLYTKAEINLCVCPVNERRRYNVTSSLIGSAHSQNDPCKVGLSGKPSWGMLMFAIFYIKSLT